MFLYHLPLQYHLARQYRIQRCFHVAVTVIPQCFWVSLFLGGGISLFSLHLNENLKFHYEVLGQFLKIVKTIREKIAGGTSNSTLWIAPFYFLSVRLNVIALLTFSDEEILCRIRYYSLELRRYLSAERDYEITREMRETMGFAENDYSLELRGYSVTNEITRLREKR